MACICPWLKRNGGGICTHRNGSVIKKLLPCDPKKRRKCIYYMAFLSNNNIKEEKEKA